ncbi:MFS transporter [Comamonas testosteroni]|uniref:MFS transporter n=1 Tax=Comamonas testosteroni TaxID=285 RepID=UPI002DBBA677|nr:MFS transporter [Comamonas testosteroni]MEB5965313.1 MFS transporter [Comamonas testosteroni]
MDQEKNKLPALPSLRYPRAALALLSLAQLMIALDATIVFVALDAMGMHLQLPAHHLQWVISGYSVAFGGCLLLGGRCADLLGQRRMYVAAMGLFGLASLAGGFAVEAWLLIAARAAQGVGAALLFPATLAMINTLYRPGAERNRALAVWSMASAAGLAAGALLGGVLTQWLGWHWVLWVLVPMAWPCAVAALRYLPPMPSVPRHQRRFDVAGCISVTLGSSLLVTALVQGPQWGWLDGRTLAVALAGVLALAVFLAIEKQVAAPLMPLPLLRVRGLQHAMLLTLLFMSCYGVQYYFLGLYFQQVLGWSPLQAGLAFVLPTIVCTVGIRWAERGLARHSARIVLMAGWAAGLVWTAAVLPMAGNYWWLVPGFVVMSIGQGASWTGMWVMVGEGIAPQQQGVASGVAATAQQVGAALGLAVLVMVAALPVAQVQATGSVNAQALQQANALGLQNAEWGTALIALVALLVCAVMGHRPMAQELEPQLG